MERSTVITRTFTLFFITSCFVGYSVVSCSANLAYEMSIEEMTERADVILVGKVASIFHCPADLVIPRMHRQVLVSVERYLKNPLNSTNVTVAVLGATIGNTTMWVSDQPEFNVSERVLLFLRDDPWFLEENPNGFYQVIGECQGKFTIKSDADYTPLINDTKGVVNAYLRVDKQDYMFGEKPVLLITNMGSNTIQFGTYYWYERYTEEGWKHVPWDKIGWTLPLFEEGPHEFFQERLDIPFTEAGRYRVCKEVEERESNLSETLCAEFLYGVGSVKNLTIFTMCILLLNLVVVAFILRSNMVHAMEENDTTVVVRDNGCQR